MGRPSWAGRSAAVHQPAALQCRHLVSRGTQTQTIVADSATDADRDAAFSLYFLLGFLSQPLWVLITGYLMDKAGFSTALTVLSSTYILGIVILCFVRDERRIGRKSAA